MDPLPKELADPGWVSDLATGGVRRKGWGLKEAGAVADGVWNPPVLEGLVTDGGNLLAVSVNLKSKTFIRANCDCGRAVGGRLCEHAMALLYAFGAVDEVARPVVRSTEEVGSKRTKSIGAGQEAVAGRHLERAVGDRSSGVPFGPLIEGTRQYLAVELPGQEHPAYSEIRAFLERCGFTLEPSNRRWWLRGESAVGRFFETEGVALWEEGWRPRFSDRFQRAFGEVVRAEVEVRTDAERGIVAGAWSAPGLSGETVAELARTGRRMVPTDRGWVLFGKEARERAEGLREGLGATLDASGGFSIRVSRPRIVGVLEVLETLSPQTRPPQVWAERFGKLRQPESLGLPEMDETVRATLRPYQLVGVAWLYYLAGIGLGGILADEMGLGKTVQALVAVDALLGRGDAESGAGLIVCPAALVENWAREAGRFVPRLKVRTHHGPNRGADPLPAGGIDLVVTTYETLARDIERFRQVEWRVVVADEAQQVRNRKTRRAKALVGLMADTRFVLTGTPIENSIEDLFSLFSFLLPGLFGVGLRSVAESGLDTEAILAATRPYILRRRKRDVARDLPERIEMEIPCPLVGRQEALYRKVFAKLEEGILAAKAGNAAARMRIFAELTRLRQICAEPRVIDPSLRREDSAKAVALRELIDEIRAAGSRALVFSQFTRILRMAEADLAEDGVGTLYLDGSTRNRQELCDRFNGDPDLTVFLISIQAGGTGLNLTGADTVILLDPWWNPAVEAQAIDRAHRIGQEKTVTAIRLIAPRTVEDRVRALQREKGELLEQLFTGAASDGLVNQLTELFLNAGSSLGSPGEEF